MVLIYCPNIYKELEAMQKKHTHTTLYGIQCVSSHTCLAVILFKLQNDSIVLDKAVFGNVGEFGWR